ncbi:MAG TPA: acyltransferase, partial [Polyangiaceae bacterium]
MSSPIQQARLRHVPALDGLRGLALLGVLLFHANGALPGGYLGVDLFFVLSGFLITSLLLAEQRETGQIALAPFWVRRARRLFPALLSLMPVVAIYGRYFARTDELLTVRAQALAALAYVANWQAIFRHQSYWQLFAAPSPLEHTWSLSIEEQFYVVWPVLLSFVLRRRSARTLLVLCLVLSALSMAAMLYLFDAGNTTRAYLGTDTRMAGILLGAALATLISPNDRFGARVVRVLDGCGLLAALGLAVAWATLRGTNAFLYHGGFWLTELAALSLIACAIAGERSWVARALSIRPLTWLGTISYGVYLWHWPVNVFLSPERTHVHGLGLHVLRFTLTLVIAIVSYRFLEQPIRKHGVPFNRPLYIVPAAVALSVFLVVHATYAEGRSEPAVPSAQLTSSTSAPEFVRFRIAVFGD